MDSAMIADILQAASTLVAAIALLVIAIRGFRRLEAKVGNVHVVAEQVNAAVNNVGEGHPTLRNVVVKIGERLDEHIAESSARLDRIEDHITKPKKRSKNEALD